MSNTAENSDKLGNLGDVSGETSSTSLTAPLAGHGTKPNVADLMSEIRARVLAKAAARADEPPPHILASADCSPSGKRKAGDLFRSDNLRYLNTFKIPPRGFSADQVKSHRPGLAGWAVANLKKKVGSVLGFFLEPYLQAQREYYSQLNRFLVDSVIYTDQRDYDIFWELIRKIDYDIGKTVERGDRSHAELLGSVHSLRGDMLQAIHEHLGSLRESVAKHDAAIAVLDGVTKGLESIVARLPQMTATAGQPAVKNDASSTSSTTISDPRYLLLENRYRGSQTDIRNRLQGYVALYKDMYTDMHANMHTDMHKSVPSRVTPSQSASEITAMSEITATSEMTATSKISAPVLEIGAGRGELQLLFKEVGINSFGVDLDAAMVEEAHAQSANVKLADGLEVLRQAAPQSLAGVIAIQVLEHLPVDILRELLRLTKEKVMPGGRAVFETINPRSLLALSSNYFRDLTHVFPLHPDTLGFEMELAGLSVVETRYLSPVSKEAQLREIPIPEDAPPRFVTALEGVNRAFDQLNELIYGYQDYALVGEVK